MPDLFDQASQLEQQERDSVLAAQCDRSRQKIPSRENCKDCDEPIPSARRAFGGVTRCIECQEFFEKTGR
ncbi:TraR/DksA C4-type zinc finger protein [Microbulbifer sp. OS29]|uniref:TraR/DksA C4-type zinc finger protein n=1 Tax=Microbulbifer okhotskensis TaxID=2926617 RepID=A0A9X2J6I8_9GAMM|nr:TraR/DksA C4-type zinc finger protein [Microbulbifer okhotskensis]MCO1336328.1 TraR/DksA C4-type zinc finger protein [Microbulbifer okhotskensis]